MYSRVLTPFIQKDLEEKIVLLSGPRQVGKTTLSRELWKGPQAYLNFDHVEDRAVIRKRMWDRNVELVVFDELHKWKNWKGWIKGIYDVEGVRPRLLVTGSARMDVFKKGGDSLAGRNFSLRLHPLSIAELKGEPPRETLDRILKFGGFPEPFRKDSSTFAARWRRGHLERIIREDLLDLERVRDVKNIELLVDLLAERVGSPVSYSSLARDLEVSPHTVKHWVQILEKLYVIFVLTPYSSRSARGLRKEPKIYFYDTGRIPSGDGPRFENLIATHLLKRKHYLEDTQGVAAGLFYLRDREKREVDFVTTSDRKIEWFVEAKLGDSSLHKPLAYFTERFRPQASFQLVRALKRDLQIDSIKIVDAAQWLSHLET